MSGCDVRESELAVAIDPGRVAADSTYVIADVDELNLQTSRFLAARIDHHALDAGHRHELELEVDAEPFLADIQRH